MVSLMGSCCRDKDFNAFPIINRYQVALGYGEASSVFSVDSMA